MSVDAISFSAHADYDQTAGFVSALAPPHVVLVHGEAGEMMRLKTALERNAVSEGAARKLHTPRVVQTISIPAAPRRVAAVVGRLAEAAAKAGEPLKGVYVARGARGVVVHPDELPAFTKLNTGRVMHKQVGRVCARAGSSVRCACALSAVYLRSKGLVQSWWIVGWPFRRPPGWAGQEGQQPRPCLASHASPSSPMRRRPSHSTSRSPSCGWLWRLCLRASTAPATCP